MAFTRDGDQAHERRPRVEYVTKPQPLQHVEATKRKICGRAMPSLLLSTGPCPEACIIDALICAPGASKKRNEKEHDDDEEEEEEGKEVEGNIHRSSVAHFSVLRHPFDL